MGPEATTSPLEGTMDIAGYPYDIDDDGTATCYHCNSEGLVGNVDHGVHACPVCGGDAFLSAEQVAYYILCAEEVAAERARYMGQIEAARAGQPVLVGTAAEEPF